jgi:arylsulfatase
MKLAMRLAPWEVFRLREHLPSYAYVPLAAMLEDTCEILRTRDHTRPLFLYMQPVDPHGPYQPPLRYIRTEGATFRREDYVSYWKLKAGVTVTPAQRAAIVALYDGAIAYADAQMGHLFDLLRERDLFDQALIIVTSDHGEQFAEHGLWRHSNSLYQQLLHVPLMVKYPGQRTGRVVDGSVSTIDVMPTVLRTLDAPCPTCEGRPLQDAQAGVDATRAIFSYLMDHDEVRPVMRGVVADGWKLVREEKHDGTTEQLFHLTDDPEDQNDVRASHPEVATRLAGLISDYEAAAGPAPTADSITLKPAELERLRALGYVQ